MASAMIPENWASRAKCPACAAVVWIDTNAKVSCLCGASWIDSDGALCGIAETTNDSEMVEFIRADTGRLVTPQYVPD